MNVLITGGAGYIGSALALKLTEQNHHVIVIDTLVSNGKNNLPQNIEFYPLDIRNIQSLSMPLKCGPIEVVIHLAALSNSYESLQAADEFESVNVVGTECVINFCKINNIKRIMFASSASVYGNNSSKNLHTCSPLSPYGQTKLQAEKKILSASLSCTILRLFNVAGASPQLNTGQNRKKPFHLVDLSALAALGLIEHLSIYGTDFKSNDGTAIRDYIHLDDVVRIFLIELKNLMTNNQSKILNCGTGNGSSVLEVIHMMEKISGKKIKISKNQKRLSDPTELIDLNPQLHNISGNLESICKTSFEWEKSKLSL